MLMHHKVETVDFSVHREVTQIKFLGFVLQ